MDSALQVLTTSIPWLEVLGVASAIYMAYKIIDQEFLNPLAKIPGPRPSMLTHLIFEIRKIFVLDRSNIPSFHKYYGPIVRVGPNTLWVASASSIRKINGSHQYIKGADYDNFPSSKENVFSTRNPDYHRIQKRLIMPSFTPKALADMEPYIYDMCISRLVNTIGEYADDGKVADLMSLFRNMTFDAIGEIGFGKTFEFLDESKEKHPIIRWVTNIITLAIIKNILGKLFLPSIFPKLKKDHEDFDKFTLGVIRKRREEIGKERNDILQQLVTSVDEESGTRLSDEAILSEMFLLIIAGTNTTASTLTRIIAQLMDNPECYKRLQEEVNTTYPDPSARIDYATVLNMTYLDAVIHESMRIRPTVPFGMPRIVPEGGTTLDGYYVPGGTTVMVSINVMQMNEDVFPEPEVFRPERWLDSTPEQLAKMKLHFTPFSVGPRACLGRNLAWMEVRMTMVELLRHFTFEPAGKNNMRPSFLNGVNEDNLKFHVHTRRNKY